MRAAALSQLPVPQSKTLMPPVGYAYGNTIEHGDRYWQRTSPPPVAQYTERPAVALEEIGVSPAWRGTGTARRIHDVLLVGRSEPYVTLMVNKAAGGGKVHALYRAWGYEDIGQSRPSAASPVLTVRLDGMSTIVLVLMSWGRVIVDGVGYRLALRSRQGGLVTP
ncbi:hypothetical protein [Streptomyces longisporoflavus]|uniref:hypothetical protein n=1 Tax=Streptomyces longisporoflavus TaxID=28044 RepID=UPI001E5862DB|nr:hypothetical protein [Streptomyces longisporoflavus]